MPYQKKKSASKRKPTGARRRPALRRRQYVRTGGFYIKRRVPLFALNGSTAFAGVCSSSNTNILTLGTPVVAQSGGANLWDVPFSMQFALNQLDTSADITNLADRYRIVNAIIRVMTSNVALGAGAGLIMPFIEFIADHDDADVPTVSTLTQKMGVRTIGFNQRGMLSMYVKPLPAVALYNGASTAYGVPRRSPYINSSNNAVPHYGIKGVFRSVFLSGTTSCANFGIDVQLCVHARDLQ